MTDAESIQLLAALNSRALQTIEYNQMGGNNYPPQQRQQFRQPNQPNFPQQGLPNHLPPVQDFQVPQIPDYIPTNVPIRPVEFPTDANGKPIVPAEYQHLLTPQSPIQQPITPANYGNTSFEIPNYNNASSEETESKFDIIIKEIKSLKKAINKLNKHFSETKLSPQQPTETDKNDTETSIS